MGRARLIASWSPQLCATTAPDPAGNHGECGRARRDRTPTVRPGHRPNQPQMLAASQAEAPAFGRRIGASPTELYARPSESHVDSTSVPSWVVHGHPDIPGSSIPDQPHKAGEPLNVAYSKASIRQEEP